VANTTNESCGERNFKYFMFFLNVNNLFLQKSIDEMLAPRSVSIVLNTQRNPVNSQNEI